MSVAYNFISRESIIWYCIPQESMQHGLTKITVYMDK